MVENPFYNEITQVGGCWGLPENLFIYSFSSACPVPTSSGPRAQGCFTNVALGRAVGPRL